MDADGYVQVDAGSPEGPPAEPATDQSARLGLLQRGLGAIDADGDGEVSLRDVEGLGVKLMLKAQDLASGCMDQLERPPVRGGIGLLMLFYGGHFRTTAVVAKSLHGHSLARLKQIGSDAVQEYQRARDKMEESVGGQVVVASNGAPSVGQLGAAAVAVDTRPLLNSLQLLQSTAVAQVASALNENTMRFGLGLQLGRRLADMFGGRLETVLVGDGEETTEAQRYYARVAIDTACTATGLATAWALQGWAALWATCSFGAKLCVEAMGASDDTEGAVLVATSLALVGFTFQAKHWGKPPIPFMLHLVFVPVRLAELSLSQLA